jgi:predicted ATPase/WD40 repeat protein/DNA-binding SARP family transcriptional activator
LKTAVSELALAFLGQFQVTQQGQLVTRFESDKVRALLAYLAVEAGVHSRNTLAELLWSGFTAESARTNLRHSLHELRQTLGDAEAVPPFLVVTRQSIQFNPTARYTVDVETFTANLKRVAAHPHAQLAHCSSCLQALRQAADLYHGDFLADLIVQDSVGFEEWRRLKQEQFHVQAVDVLHQLANACEANGDHVGTRSYAQRQVELEPWREEAHQHLIRALARGDRSAAIAQYHACRQILARELGVEPAAETVALYEQIRHAGVGEAEPELGQNLLAPAHDPLPALLTSFVGRGEALAALEGLFTHARLVTLTGPSGSGKTRLAIAAATGLAARFADGVCMVELAAVSDPLLLPQALGAALGQAPRPQQDGQDALTSYLRSKWLLLVLDSCEHLIEAVAHWCGRWLAACPHLCILATSHTAMHIAGEQVWLVAPLPYPQTSERMSPEELMTFEAAQLFVARAQEIKTDFTLTTTNAAAVAQICRRLEGIPLALELAAARVKLLSPSEIAARLSQHIDDVIASSRAAPARHQTMRAALNWSYDLLTGAEQALLRRLAVFTGGFTLAAVEAVVDLPDTLDLLAGLVDRSLVTSELLNEQTRYRMLEIIREYAQEKLAESGEATAVRQRHLNYYLQLAESTEVDVQADGEALWLQPEADNLRSALEWALANGQDHAAVRMHGALGWYWWMRGYLNLVRELLQRALAGLNRSPPEVADFTPSPAGISGRAIFAFAAGATLALWGEHLDARLRLEQALALANADHDRQTAGLALRLLASVVIQQHDYEAAHRYVARGLAIWQELGGTWHIAWLLAHQGDMAWEQGDSAQAWLAYEASAKLPVHPGARGYPLRRMAYLSAARGDLAQALALCRESLKQNLASGDRQGIAACLVGMASINATRAQSSPASTRPLMFRRATQLLGVIESLLKTVEGRLLQVDEAVRQQTATLLCDQLQQVSPEAYAAALAEGRSMVIQQAIAFVLQDDAPAPSHKPAPHGGRISWPGDKLNGSTDHPVISLSAPRGETPARALVTQSSQLPAAPTPLIGRESELAELISRLQQPEVRLLTLVGAGGMGKTRLALAVAQAILDFRAQGAPRILDSPDEPGTPNHPKSAPKGPQNPKFSDGVYFVSLAPLTSAAALAPTIAAALGLELHGDPQRLLGHFLRNKELLLILDNFEHLLDGVGSVVEILAMAPAVKILVTSRERLHLRGEHLFVVPGLDQPADATLATALNSSSVRLFVQSAQRAQADFTLNEANLAAVQRICALVQGMPLALELAAASVGALPLEEMAAEIERSTEFLAVDWRDAPPRLRSIRAVFDWSWRLLNEAEQRVLCQLAVFHGGFTRQAAEAIAGASLPVLTNLVHKSLLQRTEASSTSMGRYEMHELLRQFAAEQLAAAPDEGTTVAGQHSAFYLAFVTARERGLARNKPREAAAAIQAEIDNVRQAWAWAARQACMGELNGSAYSLWQFYVFRGLIAEGEQVFNLAAECVHASLQPATEAARETGVQGAYHVLSKLLAIRASLLMSQSKYDQALTSAQQAISWGQICGGIEGEALGYLVQGQALRQKGQTAEARSRLEHAASLAHRYQCINAPLECLFETEWRSYTWLASIALTQEEYSTARSYLEQGLQICQALGKLRGQVTCLSDLAHLAKVMGDYAAAQRDGEQALRLARTLGFPWGEGVSLQELGDIVRLQGDYTRAYALIEQALAIYLEVGEILGEASAVRDLAYLNLCMGNYGRAQTWFDRYFQVSQAIQLPPLEAFWGVWPLAVLAHNTGQVEQALAYAMQGWQMAQQLESRSYQAHALVILGRMRESLPHLDEAASAYQQALTLFTALGHRHKAAEPQAGLARIALAQGDRAQAQTHVEVILYVLKEHPQAGLDEPFEIYLTCYRVLTANHDPRAAPVLRTAHTLLQQYADHITDDDLRRSFFENVVVHRTLQQAFAEIQGRTDKETESEGRKENAGKRSHAPSLPLSSSPSPPSSPALDGGEVPTAGRFYGRQAEVAQLQRWLVDECCRVVAVVGMGGMGKTALAATVVRAVAANFDCVLWRSLLNAPPLAELLPAMLQAVAGRGGVTELPARIDEQLALLLNRLRAQRALLVLDNLESILYTDQPGQMRPGYEAYATLIHLFAEHTHNSCLLLTSRERPQHLARWEEDGPWVRTLRLGGFDLATGQAMLAARGLTGQDEEAHHLVRRYSGNPLALKLVTQTIQELFAGDIVAFLAAGAPIFDDIRSVLDQQFARLLPLEREILVWLAIEREVVTLQTLGDELAQPPPARELLAALRSLQRRSLLEKSGDGFTLQNVVIEYVTDRLIEGICAELSAEYGMRNAESHSALRTPHSALFNRHALLKVQAKEYVRQSQMRLIVQPIADHLLRELGRAGLLEKLQQIITLLQALGQPDAPVPGYAGGNILNLLLHLGTDVTGFDFSRLCIWQAYLRGAYLPALNFASSNLAGSVFTQSFGSLQAFQFDAGGNLLVAEGSGGRVRLWRVVDGTLLTEVAIPGLNIVNLLLSPDCRTVALVAPDHILHLFDLESGHLLHRLPGHRNQIWRWRFSHDGNLLVSGDGSGQVYVWDCQSGQRLHVLQGFSTGVTALAIAPDRQLVASATVDGTIFLWDLASGELIRTLEGHTDEVAALDFAFNGTILASGSHDATIRLWEVPGGHSLHVLHGHRQPVRRLATTTAGRFLVSGGGDRFVCVWDIQTGAALHVLSSHAAMLDHLLVSPDGKTAATVDRNNIVSLWDVQRGQRSDVYPMYRNATLAVDFSPDSRMIISGGSDCALYLWQVSPPEQAQVAARLPGHLHRIATVAFHGDGTTVASGDDGHVIRLWDSNSRRPLRTLKGHTGSISRLTFSPDGRTLASCSRDQTLCLWSVLSGQKLRSLQGHTRVVTCCAFCPTTTDAGVAAAPLLASSSLDHTVMLWDSESGELLHTLRGHTNAVAYCVFSPDGRTVISSSFDQTVRLWAASSGQLLATWPTPNTVYLSLAIHPAGKLLAAAGEDHVVRLLDLDTGRILCDLYGHSHVVSSVRFSPDGQLLASASVDETVKLWAVGAGRSTCLQTLRAPGPYASMNITGVTGITDAQKAALKALGAVDEQSRQSK